MFCSGRRRLFLAQSFVVFVVVSFGAEIENPYVIIFAETVFRPITAQCVVTRALPGTIGLLYDVTDWKGCFLHGIGSHNSLHCFQIFRFVGQCVETYGLRFAGVFLDIK